MKVTLEQQAKALEVLKNWTQDPEGLEPAVREMLKAAGLEVEEPPVSPTEKYIKWVQHTLRDNYFCVDGGKCHHNCDPEGACHRQSICGPLSGSGLDGNWQIPTEDAEPVKAMTVEDLVYALKEGRRFVYRSCDVTLSVFNEAVVSSRLTVPQLVREEMMPYVKEVEVPHDN